MKTSTKYLLWIYIYGFVAIVGIYFLAANLNLLFFTHMPPFDEYTTNVLAQLVNLLVAFGFIIGPIFISIGIHGARKSYSRYDDALFLEEHNYDFYAVKNLPKKRR